LEYTTIKVPKPIRDKLEEYAKPRGLTLSGAIARLLEENKILAELKAIRELLEEQERLLRKLVDKRESNAFPEASTEAIVVDEDLPDFVSGNPWTAVLAKRGRE